MIPDTVTDRTPLFWYTAKIMFDLLVSAEAECLMLLNLCRKPVGDQEVRVVHAMRMAAAVSKRYAEVKEEWIRSRACDHP